jgi:four helix bundle protein
MKLYHFEKLEVWQKGRQLIKSIYLISKEFPSDERFGMTQQIRRAGISITCNLAEGTSRITGKEQARFSEIAFGSLMEVLNLLIAAVDLEYISEDNLLQLRPLIEEIGNKVNALRKFQIERDQR